MSLAALRGGAIATIALLALACSSCGQAEKDTPVPLAKASDSATASASASPSAAADTPTKPTIPAAANTRAGRVAFARYFLDAYSYGLGSNDASAMMAVALPDGSLVCDSCTSYARYLKKQKAKGQVRRPWQLPVRHAIDQGKVQDGLYVVDLVVNRPALADVDAAGTRHRPQKPYPNYLFEIGMTWRDNAWKATGWLEKDKG